jgi:hypothetical protein
VPPQCHGTALYYRSPPALHPSAGRVRAVTGVLSFGQMGAVLCPSVFSLLLRVTGGSATGSTVCAIPAVLVGINLLRQGK